MSLMLSTGGLARADGDTLLLPITFDSLQGDLKKALTKNAVREQLSAFNCLDGSAEKRKACTYKLGGFMQIMNETEGGKDIVGLTMICATSDPNESLKCMLAYAAAMALFAPELKAADRGKIMNILIEGLRLEPSQQFARKNASSPYKNRSASGFTFLQQMLRTSLKCAVGLAAGAALLVSSFSFAAEISGLPRIVDGDTVQTARPRFGLLA